MNRFNDSDIGYMDPEWVDNTNFNNSKNGNKERTVHEDCDGDPKKTLSLQTTEESHGGEAMD